MREAGTLHATLWCSNFFMLNTVRETRAAKPEEDTTDIFGSPLRQNPIGTFARRSTASFGSAAAFWRPAAVTGNVLGRIRIHLGQARRSRILLRAGAKSRPFRGEFDMIGALAPRDFKTSSFRHL